MKSSTEIHDQNDSQHIGEWSFGSRLAYHQFKYNPLEDIDSIRLLLIRPAPRSDKRLNGNMIHTTLSSSFGFTALSYVWGTPPKTGDERRDVWVNEKQVMIGSNLYDALLHIRDEKSVVAVWADAICINQLDFRERNHQVCKMRDIYSKADTTIIYLGGDDGGNTLLAAWNFLERECSDTAVKGPLPTAFKGDISDVEVSVLTRPWFRRVWVFQEVIVSKRPIVQCGWRKIAWDSFCEVILHRPRLNDRYGWSLENKPLFQYVSDMFLARCAFLKENALTHLLPPWFHDVQDNTGKGSYILTTLSRARRLKSSDPRDKIYAVLGISSGIDLNNDRIAIDYNKTIEQLYTDFAQYLVYSTESYDVLSYVGREKLPPSPGSTWKSWVADWRVPLGCPRTILSILPPENADLKARRQHQVRRNHCWTWNTLSSVGRIIGRIATVPQEVHLSGGDEERFQSIRNASRGDDAVAERQLLVLWSAYPGTFTRGHQASQLRRVSTPYSWADHRLALNLPPKVLKASDTREVKKSWISKQIKGKKAQSVSEQVNTSKAPTQLKEHKLDEAKELTIEDLLLLRSRMTVSWSGDISGVVNLIEDESSILEGRCLVNYSQEMDLFKANSPADSVALVPKGTEVGDFIIALKGARVPYIVRHASPPIVGIEDDPVLPLKFCELIGECFVNGYKELDSVYVPKVAENGKGDCEFVFWDAKADIVDETDAKGKSKLSFRYVGGLLHGLE